MPDFNIHAGRKAFLVDDFGLVFRIELHLALNRAACVVAFDVRSTERVTAVSDTDAIVSGWHFPERVFTVVTSDRCVFDGSTSN